MNERVVECACVCFEEKQLISGFCVQKCETTRVVSRLLISVIPLLIGLIDLVAILCQNASQVGELNPAYPVYPTRQVLRTKMAGR